MRGVAITLVQNFETLACTVTFVLADLIYYFMLNFLDETSFHLLD